MSYARRAKLRAEIMLAVEHLVGASAEGDDLLDVCACQKAALEALFAFTRKGKRELPPALEDQVVGAMMFDKGGTVQARMAERERLEKLAADAESLLRENKRLQDRIASVAEVERALKRFHDDDDC